MKCILLSVNDDGVILKALTQTRCYIYRSDILLSLRQVVVASQLNVKIILLIIWAALTVSCAVAPVESGLRYSRAAMLPLYEKKFWALAGRLAISDRQDSWSFGIDWTHGPEMDRIRLSGPLGQGAVEIRLAGDVVTVDRGGGDVRSSANSDGFIEQQLGVYVPVRALRYWVMGLPDPEQVFHETDIGFSQAGWLSEYKQMQLINDEIMPYKMAVMNGKVKIKLVVDRWELNNERSS